MLRFDTIVLGVNVLIYLVNLAAVVSIVCGLGLSVVRLRRGDSAPWRHGFLVLTLLLVLASPATIWLAQRHGMTLVRVAVANQSEGQTAVTDNSRSRPNRLSSLGRAAEDDNAPTDQIGQNAQSHSAEGRPIGSSAKQSHVQPTAVSISAGGSAAAGNRSTASPSQRHLSLWQTMGSMAALTWAVGAFVALVRLAWGCATLVRFRRRLRPLDDSQRTSLIRCSADALGLRILPQLFVSPCVGAPVSLGLFRPAIILPEAMADADDEEWQAVLLHEMAHVARRDCWVGVGQRIAIAIFWWNPLVHCVSSELADLREEVCDNHVMLVQGEGQRLARVLVDLASRTAGSPPTPFALGILEARPTGLLGRVTRLLEKERTVETRIELRSLLLMAAFGLAALVTMTTFGGLRLVYAESKSTGDGPAVKQDAVAEHADPLRHGVARLSGIVRGADGQVVAGAEVYVELSNLLEEPKGLSSVALPREESAKRQLQPKQLFRVVGHARTDPAGRFTIEPQSLPPEGAVGRIIVAAKHRGLAVQPWDGKPTEIAIRLPAMVLIEGRLLDPDHRPAAGVVVKAVGLSRGSDWIPMVHWLLDEKDYPPYWPRPVRSGRDGEFTISGVPAGHHLVLDLSSPSYAREVVRIDTGEGLTERSRGAEVSLLPPVFTHVLETPRPVEGVVTAADTGKPLTGVLVDVTPMNRRGGEFVYTHTDAAGRYRVSDKAAESYGVTVLPPPDSGYLAETANQAWPKGPDRLTKDFKLKRGIPIRGRVLDGADGKPVAGASVEYHAAAKNPNRLPHVRDRSYEFRNDTLTDSDGRFVVTGVAGSGYLTVETPERVYVRTPLAASGQEHRMMPMGYTPIEVSPGAEKDVVIRLQRGRTVTLRAVGPDGRRLAAVVAAWAGRDAVHENVWNHGKSFLHGEIVVRGIASDRTTRVFMIDMQKRIGGVYDITSKTPEGPVEVRLQPTATITGQAVGEDGEPADAQAYLQMCFDPQVKRLSTKSPEVFRYEFYDNFTRELTLSDRIPGGRFRFDNVLPGIPLDVVTANRGQSCIRSIEPLRPGERRDLGRLVMEKEKR